MKKLSSIAVKVFDFFRRASLFFQQKTGQSLVFWISIALLNFILQIIFRHEFVAGAFGRLNTVLGVIGLMTLPLVALNQAFTQYLTGKNAPEQQPVVSTFREAAPVATQWVALAWGPFSIVLLCFLMPALGFSNFTICFLTILTVLAAVASLTSAALYQSKNQWAIWLRLVTIAALVRVIVGAEVGYTAPRTQAGIIVFLLTGIITAFPLFLYADGKLAWQKNWQPVIERNFLLYLGATFSVVVGLFLFSSADRIVAQKWFGVSNNNNLGWVNWEILDGYQTAGLLGRALLWGTQPLLLIFFAQRAASSRTTLASLQFLWIYLGALFLGAFLLALLGEPLSWLFCGSDFQTTARLAPHFALVMVPLGLLQALGTFVLASRRYPECFVLGACGVGYAVLLYNVGRQPQLMLAYMFGGALVAIMMVLFVGIVRWSRTQP